MATAAQRNFSGGEVAPSTYNRVDTARYQTQLRTMLNFLAQKHGGAATRPGTERVADAKIPSNKVRLIEYVETESFIIEMGHQYLRFHQMGRPVTIVDPALYSAVLSIPYVVSEIVVHNDVNYYCIANHDSGESTEPGVGVDWQNVWYALTDNIFEIPSPYNVGDLPFIQFSQEKKVVTLVHPSYPIQELTRTANSWILTPAVIGPSIASPTGLVIGGGTDDSVMWHWAVTAVRESGEESLPALASSDEHSPSESTPTTLTWAFVPGAKSYNVYRSKDGVTYGFVERVGGTNLASATNTMWSSASDSIGTSTRDTWVPSSGQARMTVLSAATDKASDGKYRIRGRVSIVGNDLGSAPLTTQGRIRAYYKRGSESRQDAGILYTTGILSGEGAAGPFSFDAVITVPDNDYTTLVIDLVPEVFGTADGPTVAFVCSVDQTTAPDDSVSWNKSGTGYSDALGEYDTTMAPPADRAYFREDGQYPSCVTNYQQRRVFAGTNKQPGIILASTIGSGGNFTSQTPPLDSGPIVFEMNSKKAVMIRHVLDLARLVVFTSQEEKVVEGRQDSGILAPDALNVRNQSYNGANFLAPIVTNDVALYVQARGNQVRMFQYDSSKGSQSVDLTLYATHLFRRRKLLDWSFAHNPDSIVWVVRSDGVLLGLTFMPEQDVWGWHRHTTDGEFENVCVLPEEDEDRVYVVVKRVVNGQIRRSIERMALPAMEDVTDIRDMCYMDCSTVAFDGRNQDSSNNVTLTGGISWESGESLTLNAAVGGTFVVGDAGKTLLLVSGDDRLYFDVVSYVSGTQVTGTPREAVPTSLRNVATSDFARCTTSVSGLEFLEGKAVSVLGDGFVVASPFDPDYEDMFVSGGAISLAVPYSVVRVGLAYISDLETLDIDIPTATLKHKKWLVPRVILYLENSGNVWVGHPDEPTEDNVLEGLNQFRIRDSEAFTSPTRLVTDSVEVSTDSRYNNNGRVLVRNVDPLPVTVLMVAPVFDSE